MGAESAPARVGARRVSGLIIVDTDILIDAALQVTDAVNCLADIEGRSTLAVSVITQMELLVGCRNKAELRNTERFLRRFHMLRLDERVCDSALDLLRTYRLSHGLTIPDALIAATALTLDQAFITKNQRDYRFIHERSATAT
jgi:predicted nucleic acid-binding protein